MSTHPSSSRPKALVAAAVLTLLLTTAGCDPLPPAPPGGTAADCRDIAWGSTTKSFARMSPSPISGVRVGQHRCFDRFVVDLRSDPAPGWFVRYSPLFEPGTGDVVPLRGGASIEVVVRAPTHTAGGTPTYDPPVPLEAVGVGGFRTFRQVAHAGSFEGQSSFGLGVRARLPFRVFGLEGSGGTRLVVDVAHEWA